MVVHGSKTAPESDATNMATPVKESPPAPLRGVAALSNARFNKAGATVCVHK